MLHVSTSLSAGRLLQHALKEPVLILDYDFEVGNLKHLELPVHAQLSDIDEPVKFWCCNNAREITALYYLCHQLPFHLIKLMNLSEHLDLLNWDVRSTNEIGVEQAKMLNQLEARQLSESEYNHYQSEWQRLANESGDLRIMRQQVCTNQVDYYDDIIKYLIDTSIPNEQGLVHPARIVGEMLGNTAQCISDTFFHERLKHVIHCEGIKVIGSLKEMRDYQIKVPGVVHFPIYNGLEYVYVEGDGPCKVILQPLDEVFIGYYYQTDDDHFLMMNPAGVGHSKPCDDERHLEDYAREFYELIKGLHIKSFEIIAYNDAYYVAKQLVKMYDLKVEIEHIDSLEDDDIEGRLMMASIKKDQSDEALLDGISIQSDSDVVSKAMMQNYTSRKLYEAAYKRLSHWDSDLAKLNF
ncbi:DUF3658 domain-containing protein [Macrococcus sp. DPC7161]|uniref:DUF3658 domain-containing protein n=1 Tax=Macrococcus sp. DPC7161 TaxID=2507060 RepID=UPI0013E976B7|nr:DUF3658 domain-containing protein [Macrococcus sp. DPC7161]